MAKRQIRRSPLVRCDMCGAKKARTRRVTRSYGGGKDLLVIENIPVVNCPACGETDMPTLRVLADRPRTPARFVVLGSAATSTSLN